MSDSLVVVIFSRQGGTAEQDNQGNGIRVYGEAHNKLEIQLYPSSFAPRLVECELQIYSGATRDTLVTSAMFNFRCRSSMTSANVPPEWPMLVDMLQKIEQGEAERAENEEGRIQREAAFSIWEAYDASKAYELWNKVSYMGSTYLCVEAVQGVAPPNTAYWLPVAAKGQDGAGSTSQIPFTLPADPAQWVEGVYTLRDERIVDADTMGDVFIAQQATIEQNEALGAIRPQVTAQGTGFLMLTAWEGPPSMDIPMILEVRS